jgi:threonine/homoserine efflux transporter RhtA
MPRFPARITAAGLLANADFRRTVTGSPIPTVRTKDYLLLTGLAAIWGGSFLFMRIAAPVLGPVLTTDLRVIIASVVLLGWLKYTRADGHWHLWKHYLVAGVILSAFPYLCFAYAALHIPAGYSAILNSSSPTSVRSMARCTSSAGTRRVSRRRCAPTTRWR